MVLGGKMEQIRVYFLEIIDLNNQKHQIKSDDYNKILNFVQMYGGKVNGINMGNRLISKEKLLELLEKIESMRKGALNDKYGTANLLAGEKG